MSQSHVLVVGGAGFIGSHVTKMLSKRGFNPLVFDDLSTGNLNAVTSAPLIKGDIACSKDLDLVFSQYPINCVMHFAALTDVGASFKDPIKYYIHNVCHTLNLLRAMNKYDVKTLVFSSSAAIFGVPTKEKIDEAHPCFPINPYGETKLIVEKILTQCDLAYGLKSTALRYFNAAGGDSELKMKNFKREDVNLIPLILRSLKIKSSPITLNGTDYPTPDGTCVRDYIHVEDISLAHVLALERLLKERVSLNYNLGNEIGYSVRQVIKTVESVTGLKVDVIEGNRRQGDPATLIACSKKIREELGWKPKYPLLESMIVHASEAMNFER